MSELTIVLKVEVDEATSEATSTVGSATARVVRAGGPHAGGDTEPTVILVRIER